LAQGEAKEREAQVPLLRDIFGNPFRPVTLEPAWLTSEVKTLAQTIYNDRTFERLPELADALAGAGCSNPDILSHCRGPGPHVRGCWVVDLVLGKREGIPFFALPVKGKIDETIVATNRKMVSSTCSRHTFSSGCNRT
jgi:hypothetical protein